MESDHAGAPTVYVGALSFLVRIPMLGLVNHLARPDRRSRIRGERPSTGPTPGVVISLRQTSSWHTISTIIFRFDLQKAQLFERALRRGGIAGADEKGPPM
jgi:hypothetical protein